MSTPIDILERKQLRDGIPQFKAGDTVRVHFQVIEGQRRRVQVFEGIVIKRQVLRGPRDLHGASFGVGVERMFPVHSPKIEKIEVMAIGDVNRAKLYYLRSKVGRRRASARSSVLSAILGPVRKTGRKLLNFDRRLGVRFVAGADEAGRGSLAGPTRLAAVLFDYDVLRDHKVRARRHPERLEAADLDERARLFRAVTAAQRALRSVLSPRP